MPLKPTHWAFKINTPTHFDAVTGYPSLCLYLVGSPHSGGLRHPLPGVDPCVNPDGRTLGSSGAELKHSVKIELVGCGFEVPTHTHKHTHLLSCPGFIPTLSTYMGLFS